MHVLVEIFQGPSVHSTSRSDISVRKGGVASEDLIAELPGTLHGRAGPVHVRLPDHPAAGPDCPGRVSGLHPEISSRTDVAESCTS